MSTVHGGVSHGQSGGAGKVLVAIKKCKSLEYKPLKHEKAHSSRELSNVWDLLERRPECAAKMRSDAAALALPKTAKGKSKAVSSGAVAKHDKNPGVTLQNGQVALKHIAKRKEQLESILQHLNGSLSATTKPAAARKDKKPKSKKPKTKPPVVLSPYRDSSADVQDSKETLVRESTVDFRSGGYLPFQAFSDAKRSAEPDLATMQVWQLQFSATGCQASRKLSGAVFQTTSAVAAASASRARQRQAGSVSRPAVAASKRREGGDSGCAGI